MKKKKPKVSYRELLDRSGPAPPPAASPPAAPIAPTGKAPGASPGVDLSPSPPAKGRHRERFSTPRQLAAVLNPGAKTPAGGVPIVSEVSPTPEPPPPKPAVPPAAEAPVMRPSQMMIDAVASDTMEFAVEAATLALPFRDHVKARSGSLDIFTFRVGTELFGMSLAAVEEVLEIEAVTHVPEMRENMLGVFNLRDRLVPVYTPARALGIPLATLGSSVLVLHDHDRLVGIAVDDVHDVLPIDLGTVRSTPGLDSGDGVLLGVARHGRDLIAILDAEALVDVCLSEPAGERA